MDESSCSTASVRSRGDTSPEDIARLSTELLKSVRSDQLVRAKLLVKNLNREERMAVSRGTNDDGCSPLFIAAQLGRISFVNFLLDECCADIEQRGTYEVAEDRSRHQVTPLWCAAVADKLEVVRTLIRHGAEVNALSDTQSTPVRSACYMTNIDVVRYLVDNGADIHQPNVNGGTCLINSVQSVELCQFLIERGAAVNAVDNSGNLALHYAIREGRFDAVHLLLKHGSDTSICNDFGDDAIQTAALRGHAAILEHLIEELKPTARRRSDAYSLIGANFIDEKHDSDQALSFWIKSANIRMEELADDPVEGGVSLAPNPMYNYAVEAHDIDSLADIASDVDAIYMQALVVRERILGPDHKDTIFGLMYRGAVYADLHAYQRCIDLWKYAFWLRRTAPRSSLLAHEYLFTLQALCKLFWEIFDEDSANVRFVDVSDVLAMTVAEINETASASNVCPTEKTILLQLSIHLVHLSCCLMSTEAEMLSVRELVGTLVQTRSRTSDGRTLLHLAVDPASSSVAEERYSELPSAAVVACLLAAGAAVNDVDASRNTPLHVAVSSRPETSRKATWLEVIDLLLHHGVHVDIANAERQIASDMLPPTVNILNHVSLKCLAAHTIRTHNLPYRGIIPNTLADFVDMH